MRDPGVFGCLDLTPEEVRALRTLPNLPGGMVNRFFGRLIEMDSPEYREACLEMAAWRNGLYEVQLGVRCAHPLSPPTCDICLLEDGVVHIDYGDVTIHKCRTCIVEPPIPIGPLPNNPWWLRFVKWLANL